MSKELDYDGVDWSLYFKLDNSSPSGLSWNANRYILDGRVLATWPGKHAGWLGTVKNKDNKAWNVSIALPHNSKSVSYKLHRIIMVLQGNSVNGKVIDHINGNSSDNTLSNLRVTSIKSNSRNCKVQDNSPYGIAGIGMQQDKLGNSYFISRHMSNGVRVQQSFPILKLGVMEAFKQATIARQQAIAVINAAEEDSQYTDRHVLVYMPSLNMEVYKKVNKPLKIKIKKLIRATNSTGVVGISYNSNKRSYTARMGNSETQYSKSFSISKYGLLPAFAFAYECLIANK